MFSYYQEICQFCKLNFHDCCCELCDYCNLPIDAKLAQNYKNECYCSTSCYEEAKDDRRIAQLEASREREVYGDDYDSWYQ